MAAVEDELWFYRALHTHIERELLAACGSAPATLLDAGCGTAGLIRRLGAMHPAWRWTGVDLESLACELARSRCDAEILQASVAALPLADSSFDAVVSSDVLYHLDDDAAALRELYRVLKSGGLIAINVPAHKWLWSYHDVTVHGRRRYVRPELREKLRNAGFINVRATHWNTIPLPLILARRKLLPAPASGSDVRLYPKPIEALFNAAMAIERRCIGAGGTLPVGSSILATARKP
jgi:SAM-dependent methyltransferase